MTSRKTVLVLGGSSDIGRAAVDNLLPGWTKAAGQAGRVAFSLGDAGAKDLRDFSVDAGPVQIKGAIIGLNS